MCPPNVGVVLMEPRVTQDQRNVDVDDGGETG